MEPLKIRYTGFLDFQGLYRFLRRWAKEHDFKLHETVYKDKPATHGGMKLEAKWHLSRKETPFIRYHINMETMVNDRYDVEVVENGVKKKSWKGRIQIIATPHLEYDWQKKYKGKLWGLVLYLIWDKVLKREWEIKHDDYMCQIMYLLGEELKKFLKMGSYSGVFY